MSKVSWRLVILIEIERASSLAAMWLLCEMVFSIGMPILEAEVTTQRLTHVRLNRRCEAT